MIIAVNSTAYLFVNLNKTGYYNSFLPCYIRYGSNKNVTILTSLETQYTNGDQIQVSKSYS